MNREWIGGTVILDMGAIAFLVTAPDYPRGLLRHLGTARPGRMADSGPTRPRISSVVRSRHTPPRGMHPGRTTRVGYALKGRSPERTKVPPLLG